MILQPISHLCQTISLPSLTPLMGNDKGHKQRVLVITTAAHTYKIESPNLIWAVRNEQDELVAIEILDTRERKFIMRFV